jgi:hypothetical protein
MWCNIQRGYSTGHPSPSIRSLSIFGRGGEGFVGSIFLLHYEAKLISVIPYSFPIYRLKEHVTDFDIII